MTGFDQLGLRDELLRVLDDAGIEHPTALQTAAIPVLRRGGNLVARASTGAGKTLAYGLGVLDRLEARPAAEDAEDRSTEESVGGVRVLVLVPTPEAAERVALALAPYAHATELHAAVPDGTWGTPTAEAELLVATPAQALGAVRGSELKLDAVESVVVDDIAAIETLSGFEAVELLLDLVPRDAQRVVLGATLSPAVADIVDRRVKRALRFPPEPAVPDLEASPPEQGEIGYALVHGAERIDALARVIAECEGDRPVLFFRSDERAANVVESLAIRGWVAGDLEDTDADLAIAPSDAPRAELLEQAGGELGPSVSFDVPSDELSLLARHQGDENALILLSPRELPHLREIARRARVRLRTVALPVDSGAAEIETFRDDLRRAVREEDLGTQMLLLEPLFAEFGAAEVAAAASALLRRRVGPVSAAPERAPDAPARQARPVASPTVQAGNAPATWARLFVGVGDRDGVRPGDLVGAIAGETSIPGARVGRIDIRENFSIVEVHADVAEAVIRAVNGTSIKGRSVRVDYDRGGDRSRARVAERGARPPMRRESRPPR